MANNKDSVELSEYCFNVCEVLKTVIHGKDPDDLSEPVRTGLEDLGRYVDLVLVPSTSPQTTPGLYGKSSGPSGGGQACHSLNIIRARLRGASWRSERCSVLSTYRAHSSMNIPPWVNVPLLWRPLIPTPTKPPQPLDPKVRLSPTFTILYGIPIPPDPSSFNPNTSACGRLIRREFAPHELSSLIEVILTSKDASEMIRCLSADDVQTFVDVIDEVCSTFAHIVSTQY